MISYIFRYFNIVGLGETTRLLLTAVKVKWTEESSDFEQGKLDHPNDCPVVLIQKSSDGSPDLVFNAFIPMELYLARTYDFLPADPSQAALQEQLCDEQRGVLKNLLISAAIGIEATQVVRDLVFTMFEERLEKFINAHTELLRKNGHTAYSFGSTLSYADLTIYSFMKLVIIEFAQSSKDTARRFKGKMTPKLAKSRPIRFSRPTCRRGASLPMYSGCRVFCLHHFATIVNKIQLLHGERHAAFQGV